MDIAKRLYVDFEPSSEVFQEKEGDTIVVHLAGFSSEQMRVEADTHGNLRASGERPLDGSRWSRFAKDFRLPPDCDVNNIQATFEDDTLYVILPKRIPPAAQKPSAPLPPPPPPPPPPQQQQPPPLERKKPAAPPPTPEPPREKRAKGEEKERAGGLTKESERPRRRTLLLNVAVAVAVLVGMGVYVIFKALSSERSK